MTRIIVTGSRNYAWGLVWATLNQALADLGPFTLVVGDCPTGADDHARAWAEKTGTTCEVYTANWAQHGKAAGPIRNRAMVLAGADLVLAFPLGTSRGTRDCMAAARNAGIPVKEIAP